MRPQLKWILSAALVALVLSPALGQFPSSGELQSLLVDGVNEPLLLSNDGVKKEINLTATQSDRVRKVMREVFDKYQPDLQKARGDREGLAKLVVELTKETRERVRKALPDILKPGQIKRLNQIQIQTNGILSFKRKDVQEQLKLTIKQKLEILQIGNDLKQKITDLFKEAADMPLRKMPAAVRKSKELKDAATQKALDTLSSEQKKTWKEMTGEKFDFKFELPIGRNRRNNI